MPLKKVILCLLFFIALSGCVNQPTPLAPEDLPAINLKIAAPGHIPALSKAYFLRKMNSKKSLLQCLIIAQLYESEARMEGINSDIAFAQMCLETGFLRYGGTVLPEQNNFCGLGTLNASTKGAYFNHPREGIRAHIQHLKAYGTKEPLTTPQIDPRFHLVQRGIAPFVEDLSGKWATDPKYHYKILSLLLRLLQFHYTNPNLKFPRLSGLVIQYQNQGAEYHHQVKPIPKSSHE
ncbi:MAG: glucosaminidase domain-containing protein [Spirochaetales bacterium]|nr:glucosaminidase domain-containing protein [Spirochaetales bacterium]